MDPLITIVIPTISERAHWLEGCEEGYRLTTEGIETQVIVVRDAPTCAVAWNEGIEQANAPFIHLTADDIVPHPGWWQAAQACDGYVPAPLILSTDGTLQSCGGALLERDGARTQMSRIPWATRELFDQIGEIPGDMHYFTDDYFSWAARKAGFGVRVCHAYKFTHHMAPERREEADARLQEDGVKFRRIVRRG